MGKIVYPLFLAFAIQLALVLFAGQAIPGTALYDFLLNPASWDSTPFFSAVNDILIIFGGAAIVTGLYFIRNEWIIYAGLGAVLISFGASFYNAWQFINSQAGFGDSGTIIATLVISPLLILFLFSILDFTRGKD